MIVISAAPGSQPRWTEAQARLAGISTNGVQRVLDATHESESSLDGRGQGLGILRRPRSDAA
jgi:hypothetical protein